MYVYTEKRRGKAVRRAVSLQTLLHHLNAGVWRLEFLCQYRDGDARIVEAALHVPHRPYQKACELRLTADRAAYCWNALCPEKTW